MHEAGIAAAIAAEVRERGLDPTRIRLIVSGGHGDETSFDAALRVHLEAADRGAGFDRLEIVHAPVTRLCASCATAFDAALSSDPCPACGGPGLAIPRPESVELESLDPGIPRLPVTEAPHDEAEHDHPKPAQSSGAALIGDRSPTEDARPGRTAEMSAEGPDRPGSRDSRHSMQPRGGQRLSS